MNRMMNVAVTQGDVTFVKRASSLYPRGYCSKSTYTIRENGEYNIDISKYNKMIITPENEEVYMLLLLRLPINYCGFPTMMLPVKEVIIDYPHKPIDDPEHKPGMVHCKINMRPYLEELYGCWGWLDSASNLASEPDTFAFPITNKFVPDEYPDGTILFNIDMLFMPTLTIEELEVVARDKYNREVKKEDE